MPSTVRPIAEENVSKYQTIKVEKKGAILEVLFNRPDQRNPMNAKLYEEWASALDAAEDDPEIKVITVRGAGKVFSAGWDMKEIAPGYVKDGVSTAHNKYEIPALPRAWYCRKAIVAGVHEFVGAEALGFLGFCDFVIAAKGTRFSYEASRFGGDGNLFWILSLQLPMRVIKKMYMMGGWFDADQALKWDFIQRVVAPEAVEEETNRWAQELSKIPSQRTAAAKQNLHRIYELMGLINFVAVGNQATVHSNNEQNIEFYRIVVEKGMREAVKHRDSQFDAALAKV